MIHRLAPCLLALTLWGPVTGQAAEITLISSGFEAPAFTAGLNVNGQGGWSSSINAAVNYDASVSTARAATGSQSLRLSNGVIGQPNYPYSSARTDVPVGTLIALGAVDRFFMTAMVYVEEAAVGGWGMGLVNGLGGLVGMNITGDGKVTYANMNSPSLIVSDTGLSLLNTWVTLTMQRDETNPIALRLDVSTDAGSWTGSMGMPITSNTATTFYVGSSSTSTSNGSVPLAYFDNVRVGYNMASGGTTGTNPTNPTVPEPGTWWLALGALAAMAVQARSTRS